MNAWSPVLQVTVPPQISQPKWQLAQRQRVTKTATFSKAGQWQSFNSSITSFRDHLFCYKYFRQGLVSNEIERQSSLQFGGEWNVGSTWGYLIAVWFLCALRNSSIWHCEAPNTTSSAFLSSKSKSQNSHCVFPFNPRETGKDEWLKNAVTGNMVKKDNLIAWDYLWNSERQVLPVTPGYSTGVGVHS